MRLARRWEFPRRLCDVSGGLPGHGCIMSLRRREANDEALMTSWLNDKARMTNDERMTKSEDRNALDEDPFWGDGAGVVREEPEAGHVYDLEERTARFGEVVIDFAKTIPVTPVTNRIISQLTG